MAPYSAAKATSTTSHSSTRMRTLVRWSDSSFSMTTPRPEKAEPSRCIALSSCQGLFGLCLEISIVDRFKARILNAQKLQASLHCNHFVGRFRPHVTVGMKAQFSNTGLLDTANARNECEPLGKPSTVGFDVDNITTAK